MANIGRLKNTFLALVCASLLSFFLCISIGNAWFLLYIFLPYILFHVTLAFIISWSHNRIDLQTRYKSAVPHSGSWTRRNFLICIGMSSIIHTSIIFSFCKQPSCKHTTFNTNTPYIAYIIIFLIEYFNICLFIDMVIIKSHPGTRNIFYRLFMNWLCCLHFTTCLLSSFVAWLFPILALLTRIYGIFPYATLCLYCAIYFFALTGLYHSLSPTWTYVNINMQSQNEPSINVQTDDYNLNKYPLIKCDNNEQHYSKKDSSNYDNSNSLILCQITDPHIGPLMSVKRLKKLCEQIVIKEPDIILLTGDFFTGEANCDGLLKEALSPLEPIANKCFACLGNHDMESGSVQDRTLRELRALGIMVLRHETFIFESRIGPIQIIGYDYCDWRYDGRGRQIRNVITNNICPQQCNNRKIVLLHDPGAFKEFIGDENLAVFSGHTHGGHVGFVYFGMSFTFLHWVTGVPDNGLWKKGNNKLYVHRGQGSRALMGNYVIRCGVPTEQSYVRITW